MPIFNKATRTYSILFLSSIVFIELVTLVGKDFYQVYDESIWRMLHLIQMIALIFVVFIIRKKNSIYLVSNKLFNSVFSLILTGLILSFLGDLINSFLFDLSFIIQPQTLLSAIPFAIAHLLYIISYNKIYRSNISDYTFQKVTIAAWPFLSILFWYFLIDSSAGLILKYVSFVYAFIVTLMALAASWVFVGYKSKGIACTIGGFTFLLSDMVFGYFLLEGTQRPFWASQLIWVTYFAAQVLISNAPMIVQKKEH